MTQEVGSRPQTYKRLSTTSWVLSSFFSFFNLAPNTRTPTKKGPKLYNLMTRQNACCISGVMLKLSLHEEFFKVWKRLSMIWKPLSIDVISMLVNGARDRTNTRPSTHHTILHSRMAIIYHWCAACASSSKTGTWMDCCVWDLHVDMFYTI